ncbi:hypothetical protein PRZ48_010283 [Zasmidium cellare]|uniref:Mediator of RNA polymerase II transcription subunit 4 n=1 Tax=Zasmidium cellare TaxID=395010 RepID=A0ABR0E866_ZASCE|nr:hypothetical protein PRZ48_010283 [Zasmidium cellare]
MNAQFQASYQRVEASLQRLTESISAYNPSTAAAEELIAADEAVQDNVETLIKHQQNHQRLEELRRTTDALDEQIKNTIRRLADLRKDIQSIPSDESSEPRRDVKVDDLLSYAKFIAKTTVPPTQRKHAIPPQTKPDAPTTNGIATPPQATPQQDGENAVDTNNDSRGIKELGEKEREFIIPQNFTFDAWPSDVHMKNGALGQIQAMVEAGKDPASVLSPEEQAEVDRKKKEEEERQRVEEEERQKRVAAEWGYGRRQTVVEEPFNPDDL